MSIFENVGKRVGELLVRERVDLDEYTRRISICNGCDRLTKTRQCRLCYCFVDAKAQSKTHFDILKNKIVETHCDDNNW